MKDVIIIFLIILLLIAFLYLFLLKRSIRKFDKNLKNKLKNESHIILTTDMADKDFSHLVDTINKTLDKYNNIKNEYEIKNNNLQKMMINVSHDLRTPLTSALGYIDIILKSDLPEKEKNKNIKIIEERLNRVSDLINSFFEYSKIISNNENIKFSKVNLVAILEKAISNHYKDFSNENRMINFKTDNRKVEIISNEMMLDRIFDNLIRNAYKHSKSNLEVSIKTLNDIQISFSNNLLYNDLNIDRIFDEFYTVDISRTKGNNGLGLAIVKEFVEQLGGDIKAAKKQGSLIFEILLKSNDKKINRKLVKYE